MSNPALATATGQRELYIRRILEANYGFDAKSYDVIIFDCPPSVSFTKQLSNRGS